jgi:hypothetical protein
VQTYVSKRASYRKENQQNPPTPPPSQLDFNTNRQETYTKAIKGKMDLSNVVFLENKPSERVGAGNKNDDTKEWNKVAPKPGEPTTKHRRGKTYHWCSHCQFWALHRPGQGKACKGGGTLDPLKNLTEGFNNSNNREGFARQQAGSNNMFGSSGNNYGMFGSQPQQQQGMSFRAPGNHRPFGQPLPAETPIFGTAANNINTDKKQWQFGFGNASQESLPKPLANSPSRQPAAFGAGIKPSPFVFGTGATPTFGGASQESSPFVFGSSRNQQTTTTFGTEQQQRHLFGTGSFGTNPQKTAVGGSPFGEPPGASAFGSRVGVGSSSSPLSSKTPIFGSGFAAPTFDAGGPSTNTSPFGDTKTSFNPTTPAATSPQSPFSVGAGSGRPTSFFPQQPEHKHAAPFAIPKQPAPAANPNSFHNSQQPTNPFSPPAASSFVLQTCPPPSPSLSALVPAPPSPPPATPPSAPIPSPAPTPCWFHSPPPPPPPAVVVPMNTGDMLEVQMKALEAKRQEMAQYLVH